MIMQDDSPIPLPRRMKSIASPTRSHRSKSLITLAVDAALNQINNYTV